MRRHWGVAYTGGTLVLHDSSHEPPYLKASVAGLFNCMLVPIAKHFDVLEASR
jgi:hypothetical protein